MNITRIASLALLACATTASAQEIRGLAAEALAAERATWQAEVDGDVGAFGSGLDEDFVQVSTDADSDSDREPSITVGKTAAVASFERSLQSMKFGEFEIETPHARVLGDTVILTFHWAQTYLPRAGESHREQGVATSVWFKDPERGWKNVHYHSHTGPGKKH
jgi:ketosteroid isomerase-like protein